MGSFMLVNFGRLAAAAVATAVFVAAAGNARAVTLVPRSAGPIAASPAFADPAGPADSPDTVTAMQYCRSKGGEVIKRTPEYGTNGTQPLVLAGPRNFCQFTSGGKYPSSIHVLLTTLVTTQPTLAALAYYAKVKFNESTCPGGANPASCYCTQLGGSDQFGGATLAGGSWVGRGAYKDLQACIFPDMSSIDSFGLFYHSANEIRGINLAKVLQYHHKG
jgi:putative hemolysin